MGSRGFARVAAAATMIGCAGTPSPDDPSDATTSSGTASATGDETGSQTGDGDGDGDATGGTTGDMGQFAGTWTRTVDLGAQGLHDAIVEMDSGGGYTVAFPTLPSPDPEIVGGYFVTDADRTITMEDSGGALGCTGGEVGVYEYAWGMSSVTFTLVSEACNGRDTIVVGTWTRV